MNNLWMMETKISFLKEKIKREIKKDQGRG